MGGHGGKCCNVAVTELNMVLLGFKLSTNPEVVSCWFRDFCDRGNCFADPNTHPGGKQLRPRLFKYFPDAEALFCTYTDENLPVMTLRRAHGNIHYILCH